jgi:thymidylate synthase (FAD)
LCYAPLGAADLFAKMTDEQVAKVLDTILGSGHHSALEHASLTFAIDGISRACSHQLVRHRLASYNQQSQRYVKYDTVQFIMPPAIADNPEAEAKFEKIVRVTNDAYRDLLEMGVEAEDARYVLAQGVETKIVVTMNCRELLHFFTLRCCNRAQWEIRAMAWKMLDLARETCPTIFYEAGPNCVRGPCQEGKMTCGDPYPKRKRAGTAGDG